MSHRDAAEQFVRLLDNQQFVRVQSALRGEKHKAGWTRWLRRLLVVFSMPFLVCAVSVLGAVAGSLAEELNVRPDAFVIGFLLIVGGLVTLGAQVERRLARKHMAAALRIDYADGLLPQCMQCDYLARGLRSATCPECGGRVRWSWPHPVLGDPSARRDSSAPAVGQSDTASATSFVRQLSPAQLGWINRMLRLDRRWWIPRLADVQFALGLFLALAPLFRIFRDDAMLDRFGDQPMLAAIAVGGWLMLWFGLLHWLVGPRRQAALHLLRHCPDGLLPECLRCGHPTQGLQRDHCPACGERVRWKALR